jgi:putative hydrolase of the HAD superfamily
MTGAPHRGRYDRPPVTHRMVFFDAGETLLYPHPSFPELFALVMRAEGHEVDPAAVRENLAPVSELFLDAARKKEVWSNTPERSREFWQRVYGVLLDRLGLPGGEEVFGRLEREFTDLGNYRLFPDVAPTLERLAVAGYRLGVISNFEAWLERLLEHLGVARHFEVEVISGVEGVEKPDPAIFRIALERTGLRGEEAVYVGDLVEFDVAPAVSVGMLGILVDRRGRFPDHDGPRVTSLEEVPDLLGAPVPR